MDAKLIAAARAKLYSGVICDVLDSLDNWIHALAPHIRPLDESLTLFGRARTALYMSAYHVDKNVSPYEWEIVLVDSLRPDEVPVLACPPGNRVAPWGELLSTASHACKAAGAVTDGLVRDVRLIREMQARRRNPASVALTKGPMRPADARYPSLTADINALVALILVGSTLLALPAIRFVKLPSEQ